MKMNKSELLEEIKREYVYKLNNEQLKELYGYKVDESLYRVEIEKENNIEPDKNYKKKIDFIFALLKNKIEHKEIDIKIESDNLKDYAIESKNIVEHIENYKVDKSNDELHNIYNNIKDEANKINDNLKHELIEQANLKAGDIVEVNSNKDNLNEKEKFLIIGVKQESYEAFKIREEARAIVTSLKLHGNSIVDMNVKFNVDSLDIVGKVDSLKDEVLNKVNQYKNFFENKNLVRNEEYIPKNISLRQHQEIEKSNCLEIDLSMN